MIVMFDKGKYVIFVLLVIYEKLFMLQQKLHMLVNSE